MEDKVMKKKIYLKRIPSEKAYYDFEEEACLEEYGNNIVICGNERLRSYGDKQLINIINNDYYDDDCAYDYGVEEELKKVTGKEWECITIKGYSQSDWQDVWFVSKEVGSDIVEEIENLYFNKVAMYEVYCNDKYEDSVLVPDDVSWKGKNAICEYLHLDPKEVRLFEISGTHIVYDYVTVN